MQTYVNTQYCNAGSKQKRYGVRLTVVQNSQSVANNTSNITITFQVGGAGGLGLSTDYTGSSFYGSACYGAIYLNGSTTATATGSWTPTSSDPLNNNKVATIASWTGNVSHNADGTLSLLVKGQFTGGNSTQASGGVAEGWVTFDTIPRASTITATNADIGSSSTITISRASSSFRDTITYSFTGNGITRTGTIATKTANNSVSFTLPNQNDTTNNLYPLTPNGMSVNGVITCTTYNGNDVVGTSTCNITATVPSSAKPTATFSSSNWADTDAVSRDTIKLLVVGKSKLQYTFTNCFSSDYSSTLDKYVLLINGVQVYRDDKTTYARDVAIPQTSNTYEFYVVDSRGVESNHITGTITAYAYTPPTCSIKVNRNPSTTTTAVITYSANITNINSNGKNAPHSILLQYKLSTASSWSNVQNAITNVWTANNATVNKTGLSDSASYDFRIVVKDAYYSSDATAISDSYSIGTTFSLMNFNTNGQTLAFGKASEIADTIEFNIKSKFLKEVNLPAVANVKCNGTAIATAIQNAIQSSIQTAVLKAVFPVGAIYTSATDSRNPNAILGFGTWVQIKSRTLIGTGSVEANTTNWAGTTNAGDYNIGSDGAGEMGGVCGHSHGLSDGYARITYVWLEAQNRLMFQHKATEAWATTRYTTTGAPTYAEGAWGGLTEGVCLGGNANWTNTLTPYYTVYMWRRTA